MQADICQLTGLSGHADKDGLLRWVNSFEPKPKRVFIVHGNDEVEDIFAQTLKEQGFTASAPYNGEQWGIGAEGAVCIKEGNRVHIEHRLGESASRAATVFQRLVSAGKRLLRVIEHNEAVPTRTWPSLPTRSTPCATSGTDNGKPDHNRENNKINQKHRGSEEPRCFSAWSGQWESNPPPQLEG